MLATGIVSEGWGAGALSLAAGLTWRDEEFTQDNFPSYGERGVLNAPALGIRGIPAGFASAGNRSLHPFSAIGAGNGERSVWEWFSRAQHADLAVRLRAARRLDVRLSQLGLQAVRAPGQLEDRVRRGPHDHAALARHEVAATSASRISPRSS